MQCSESFSHLAATAYFDEHARSYLKHLKRHKMNSRRNFMEKFDDKMTIIREWKGLWVRMVGLFIFLNALIVEEHLNFLILKTKQCSKPWEQAYCCRPVEQNVDQHFPKPIIEHSLRGFMSRLCNNYHRTLPFWVFPAPISPFWLLKGTFLLCSGSSAAWFCTKFFPEFSTGDRWKWRFGETWLA